MKLFNIKRTGLWIGLIVAVVLSLLHLMNFKLFEILEEKALDLQFNIRGPITPGPETVIATIDEKSINRLGRFPWPRSTWGRIVDRLTEEGAKVIVFDVFFSEPETVASDDLFQKAIIHSGRVVLPMVFDLKGGYVESGFTDQKVDFLLPSAYRAMRNPEQGIVPEAKMVLPTLGRFSEFAQTLAHINMNPDIDGTLRWEMLAIKYRDEYFAPIGLQAARLYRDIPLEQMTLDFGSGIRLGDSYIATDAFGRMLINYRGPNNTFPMYSISDIIDRNLPPGTLQDKIVLIGATAIGIYDLRVTPFSTNMAGIEKHASVVDNVLHGDFLTQAMDLDVPLIFVFSLILGLLLPRFGAQAGIAFFLVLLGGYSAVVHYLFVSQGIWFSYVYPASAIFFSYTSQTAYRFFTEERRAKEIRTMFSSYVSKRIVDELIRDPSKMRLGGDRKELTVLFSDIRGFTTFSEKYRAEEVVSQLNEYLGAMTHIVFDHEGTLDKFVGDAVMAFWGAPLDQEDHAVRAVRCALDMINKLKELQTKWAAEGKHVIDIGIGINTGEMIVGNMGAAGKKMDFTVIGDNVNLAARVEGLTRKFDSHIIITEYTFARVKDRVEAKELEAVTVKGKERPVVMFNVLGMK